MARQPTPPPGTVERKRTGEVKRKLTVYLSPELHRSLGHFAVDNDCDLSAAAVIAIEGMLQAERHATFSRVPSTTSGEPTRPSRKRSR